MHIAYSSELYIADREQRVRDIERVIAEAEEI
jgi:hypothetical protein